MRSTLDTLLDFVERCRWQDLPDGTRSYVQTLLQDALTVASAGESAPGCPEVLDLASEWQTSAAHGASVFYRDLFLPPPEAAMINATLIEAWDYDDTHDAGIVHCTASVLASALAVSEWQGRPVHGEEFLTSIAVGIEALARLGTASTSPLTWTRTATLGGMAAALTAARLLGLDRTQLLDAAGIAYMQASGNSQTIVDSATAKKLQVGFAARAATLGAMLAQRGLTGPHDILEGKHGYYVLYERGRHRLTDAFASLGSSWEIDAVGVKPFPCARDTHGAIEATLEATGGEPLDPAEIEEIQVQGTELVIDVAGRPVGEQDGSPVVAAILSIPYTVSVAVLEGTVRLTDFTPDQILRSDRRELSARVETVPVPEWPANSMAPVRVRISLRSGRTLDALCDRLMTGQEWSADPVAVARKRNDCLALARGPEVARALAAAETVLSRADDSADLAAELIGALTGRTEDAGRTRTRPPAG